MIDLVIITGTSASGKSFLLSNYKFFGEQYSIIQKRTSRSSRKDEEQNSNFEFIFDCSQQEVLACEYNYTFRGEYYGFNSTAIDDQIATGKIPMIIIRRVDEIKKLKEKYKGAVAILCISCFDRPKKLLKYLVREKGKPAVECEARVFGDDEIRIKMEYERNIDIFDLVLVNNYDTSFLEKVKSFLDKSVMEKNK